MKKVLKHYDAEVIYQTADVSEKDDFRTALKKSEIQFTELPILENEVVTYVKNGVRKYACITPASMEDDIETVYLTEQIPLDMDWNNLILDCKRQINGEEPMKMKSKAKLLTDTAVSAIQKRKVNQFFENPEIDFVDITKIEFNQELGKLGYAVETLLGMNHEDVDEEFLNKMI